MSHYAIKDGVAWKTQAVFDEATIICMAACMEIYSLPHQSYPPSIVILSALPQIVWNNIQMDELQAVQIRVEMSFVFFPLNFRINGIKTI